MKIFNPGWNFNLVLTEPILQKHKITFFWSLHCLFWTQFPSFSKVYIVGVRENKPSRYLPVQSQQQKHHNNLWNLCKVNIKDTRRISFDICWYMDSVITLVWYFYISWWCSRVFIVNFEHVHHILFYVFNVNFEHLTLAPRKKR